MNIIDHEALVGDPFAIDAGIEVGRKANYWLDTTLAIGDERETLHSLSTERIGSWALVRWMDRLLTATPHGHQE